MSENIGKWLILVGIAIVVVGLIVWGVSRVGIPMGKLPGDLQYRGERTSIYFPVMTSIVVSILLTIIVNLVFWMMKK